MQMPKKGGNTHQRENKLVFAPHLEKRWLPNIKNFICFHMPECLRENTVTIFTFQTENLTFIKLYDR